MELKIHLVVITSILAFALIAAAVTGISTTSFENVLAQGENTTGMSQDQTSEGSESTAFNPEEIIKKEARGLGDDTDFGEVQEILGEYIITQKGNVAKDRFYIPKNLVERFDGDTVYFKITKEEAKEYKRD